MDLFSETNIKQFRSELENVLKEFAEKRNLKVTQFGTITFNANIVNIPTISFATLSSQMPSILSLESFVGKKFKLRRSVYTILGVKDGKLSSITTRGARYTLTREDIDTMIQI
jgi:hypothetical protein